MGNLDLLRQQEYTEKCMATAHHRRLAEDRFLQEHFIPRNHGETWFLNMPYWLASYRALMTEYGIPQESITPRTMIDLINRHLKKIVRPQG